MYIAFRPTFRQIIAELHQTRPAIILYGIWINRFPPFVHRHFNPVKSNYEICFTVPYHRRKRNYDAFHEEKEGNVARYD